MTFRSILWAFVSVLLIVLCVCYSIVTPTFDSSGLTRVCLSFSIATTGFITIFTFPDTNKKWSMLLILGIALLSRVALLPAAPSDDINRYLWEGKITSQGVSPYQAVADDPFYREHRDIYWEQMNHRERPTAYPPLAIYGFRVINFFSYHPMSYKVTFILLDLFLIATLLALLDHHQRPLHWSLIYALSPISLLSFAAEGHFDIMMILCLILSLLFLSKKWTTACGIALGLAIGVKIMAIVVAPLILWRGGWKASLAASFTIIFPILFHFHDVISMFQGLAEFGTQSRFNGPFHQVISYLTNKNYQLTSIVTTGLFLITWCYGAYVTYKNQLWSGLLICFGGLLLFSPIVHFWYLAWILPLVTLHPKLSWVSLSFTMSVYFFVWYELEHNRYWALPTWADWLFWLPFFILLLAEQRHFIRRVKYLTKSSPHIEKTKFSIIIPTYNAGEKLAHAITSIQKQSHPASEIIIVDAGSNDHSLEQIDSSTTTLIHSELGRGIQIKKGIEHARYSWAVIVHADNFLPEDALSRLHQAIENNPLIIGGSFGQRFDRTSSGLLLIEAMNEFRATLLHTSFGDQTQFFHTETVIKNDILTTQPLMEDVEMSDRLYALGDTLHLAHEGKVSAKKWSHENFWNRFFTIIEFCLKYRLFCYSRTKREKLSQHFYERYYTNLPVKQEKR